MKMRAVFVLLSCVGLMACGDDADDVPPPDKRQVSVLILDASKAENPVMKFRAENMTLGDVVRKVGSLTKQQTIALRCDGGYNKQPPLYSLDFDIIRATLNKSLAAVASWLWAVCVVANARDTPGIAALCA